MNNDGRIGGSFNAAAFTPGTVDFKETMALARSSMRDAARLLTISFLGPKTVEVPGATKLEAPKKLSMDANLLLAELQDTLNQLMQKVSVNDIKQNLQTQNDANKKQLEDMKKAAADAAAAAAKQKEADKKGNVFEAISNWVQAAVTAISIVFTAIAAVGQALSGNLVAAGALFVAVGAMGVQLGCQLALAIDSTMKASGVEGGLGIDVELCKKVMEVAGYVALAASMVGMIGGITAAMGNATKNAMAQATSKATLSMGGQTALKSGGGKIAAEVSEEGMKKVVEETIKATAKGLYKDCLRAALEPLKVYSSRMAISVGIGQAGAAAVKAGGKEATEDLRLEASELLEKADQGQADVEAMKAMIAKLQAMLENLQQALEDQMDAGQSVMDALLQPITDRMKTMQTLVQNLGA